MQRAELAEVNYQSFSFIVGVCHGASAQIHTRHERQPHTHTQQAKQNSLLRKTTMRLWIRVRLSIGVTLEKLAPIHLHISCLQQYCRLQQTREREKKRIRN